MKQLLIFAALVALTASAHADNKTKVKWYGHAAFEVDLPSGKSILIDP